MSTKDGKDKFTAVKFQEIGDRNAEQEFNINRTLRHHHIVQFEGMFQVPGTNKFGTVMEYCDGAELDTFMKIRGPLPESIARDILKQILEGMKYLQTQGIIHYDLKPLNILIDRHGKIKISDFGLSQNLHRDNEEVTNPGGGTYMYQAPECFEKGRKIR